MEQKWTHRYGQVTGGGSSVEKGQSFQPSVLGQLDIHMQKNFFLCFAQYTIIKMLT